MTAPFIPAGSDLRPFSAEIWLIAGIAANLLLPFATRRANLPCAVATIGILLLAIGSLLLPGNESMVTGQHLQGLLMFDHTACIWKLTLLSFVACVVVLWLGHSGRSLRQGDAPEFFVLLLGATLGLCLMASTTHLLMIVMAITIASLPSYLLAGFAKQNRRAAEASLKYVLFGAVTSAIMIYGVSFLYGLFGSLQLADLAAKMPETGSAALAVAIVGLLIGLGFKISAVPLHFWCPDVFEGATIEVTTFLSVASKGAALLLLLRVVQAINLGPVYQVVGWLGVFTATVGNTAAFTQTNIKRLLAYSSIAQAGYMLCVISAAHGIGDLSTPTAGSPVVQALLIYLVIYAVMNLGAFAIAAVVIRHNGEELAHFAGLGKTSPVVAGSMFCCLVSLIGLPPFAGFGAKVNVLVVLAGGGRSGVAMVIAIVLNTILSAFYYFRIIRAMYLDSPNNRSRTSRLFAKDPLGVILGSACAVGLLALFLAFGPLYTVTSESNPPVTQATVAINVATSPAKIP